MSKIEWPDIPEENLTVVNDETIKTDDFLRECFSFETKEDGTVVFHLKLLSEIHIPKEVYVDDVLKSGTGTDGMAEMLIDRILLDLNVDVLPAMRYRLKQWKESLPQT